MKKHLQKTLFLSAAVLSITAACKHDFLLKLTGLKTAEASRLQSGLKTLMVEFRQVPSAEAIAQMKQFPGLVSVSRFDSWNSDYFSRLYRVQLKIEAGSATDLSDVQLIEALMKFAQKTAPIASIEFSKEVTGGSFALQPGDQTKDLTSDPYAAYQWGLKYSGQKIIRDYTDLQSDTIAAGSQVADIGLDPKVDVDTLMKSNVVVAVMDSGVDLAHPDLVNNLYHNTPECQADGTIPVNPTTDKDGNGYNGDCIGWNFVDDTGDGNNRPDDDFGHGTHVAGIIAAEKNNKIGVSGISNRIKIMPIRITWAQESPGNKKSLSLTDRIAKGILYAAKMKAKVVNISLGWPNSTDSTFLRQAFKTAIDSGVTIVAAAGNNTTNVPVFPCAYAGVICVGATSLDGRLAPFSNYGSHVDVDAPGEEILSTYPVSIPTMTTPPAAYFSDPRYEILSGTSMAAPYVSGAVAVLKGIYPTITENEIKARLFASSQSLVASNLTGDFASAYTQFGAIKISKAITMTAQPVVAPDFKGLDRVTYSLPSNNFLMSIPITDYWKPVSGVSLSVVSDSPQLKILSGSSMKMDFSGAAGTGLLKIVGQLSDLSQSSLLRIRIAVDVPGQARRIFAHDFQASRSLVKDTTITKIPVTLKITPKAFSMLSLNKVNPTDTSEFYWMDQPQGPAAAQLQYHVMRNVGAVGYTQLDFPPLTPNQTLLSLIRVPTYNAGGAMYWIGGIGQTSAGKFISYHYYDKDLHPIAARPSIDFTPETVAIDQAAMQSLSYLPWSAKDGTAALPIPVFQTTGGVPTADQDQNWTHFVDKTAKQTGVFFLVPQKTDKGWTFQTRLFDNFAFVNSFKAKFQLDDLTSVEGVHMIPQDTDKTKISLLVSYGQSSLRKYVIITATLDQLMNHDFTIVGGAGSVSHSSTELDHATMTQVQMLNSQTAKPMVFTAPISQKSADLVFVSADSRQVLSSESLSPSFRYDAILGLISSFYDGTNYYSFLESTSHLILHVTRPGGSPSQFESNIHRSSLLPGQMFSESFHPVRYTAANGQKRAALYADATQISSNQVYVNVADAQKGIVAPLSLNVDVPPNCVSMAPQAINNPAVDDIVLLCRISASGFELEVLPIAN